MHRCEGLRSGGADVSLEEVTGNRGQTIRHGRDTLAGFCCGDSTVWGQPGDRGSIRKIR